MLLFIIHYSLFIIHSQVARALSLCERLNLHKPIVEQPQYNMFVRDRFEKEYRDVFKEVSICYITGITAKCYCYVIAILCYSNMGIPLIGCTCIIIIIYLYSTSTEAQSGPLLLAVSWLANITLVLSPRDLAMMCIMPCLTPPGISTWDLRRRTPPAPS